MKRLTLILCLLLLLIFSGCGSKQDNFNTLIAICSGKAQEYIDAGNYTAAIEVLEEGIAASDSEDLRAMLEEILAQTSKEAEEIEEPELIPCRFCEAEMSIDAKFCPECGANIESDPPIEKEPEPFDITPCLGTWATTGTCYADGGIILDVSAVNGELQFDLSDMQGSPGHRIASVQASMPLTDVHGSSFTWVVDDDGWGNSAEISIDFYDANVNVNIANVTSHSDISSGWGLSNGFYILLRDDDVYEAMQEPQQTEYEDYSNARPDGYETPEAQATYDTSKASGILASLGMTEAEFRASCQPLSDDGYDKEMITAKDLREYPAKYIGQCFYFSGDWFDLDTPGSYSPSGFDVAFKGISNDGYTTYRNSPDYDSEYIHIFDCRDDIYFPTISEGDRIYPYVIYIGVQTISGTDYVCFQLISVDKD